MSRLTDYLFATFEEEPKQPKLSPEFLAWLESVGLDPSAATGGGASTNTGAPYSQNRAMATGGSENPAIPPGNPEFGPSGFQNADGSIKKFVPPPVEDEEDKPRDVALGDVFSAYESNIISSDEEMISWLTKIGFDEESATTLLLPLAQMAKIEAAKKAAKAAEGDPPPEISIGEMLKGLSSRKVSEEEFVTRLKDFGYSDTDIALFQKINSPEGKQLGDADYIAAYTNGTISSGVLRSRLANEGYNGAEIDLVLKENAPEGTKYNSPIPDQPDYGGFLTGGPKKQQPSQAPAGNDGGGFLTDDTERARYIDASRGGGQTTPNASDLLKDFRTSFAQNLKGQAGSLSTDARRWAMENMDMFLDDYLGGLGHGGVPGQGVFTKGAAEIQTLYEGQKDRMAGRRAGAGTLSPRSV